MQCNWVGRSIIDGRIELQLSRTTICILAIIIAGCIRAVKKKPLQIMTLENAGKLDLGSY